MKQHKLSLIDYILIGLYLIIVFIGLNMGMADMNLILSGKIIFTIINLIITSIVCIVLLDIFTKFNQEYELDDPIT